MAEKRYLMIFILLKKEEVELQVKQDEDTSIDLAEKFEIASILNTANRKDL